jgi:hypothetical protein
MIKVFPAPNEFEGCEKLFSDARALLKDETFKQDEVELLAAIYDRAPAMVSAWLSRLADAEYDSRTKKLIQGLIIEAQSLRDSCKPFAKAVRPMSPEWGGTLLQNIPGHGQ